VWYLLVRENKEWENGEKFHADELIISMLLGIILG
jgi:hypothetical protein